MARCLPPDLVLVFLDCACICTFMRPYAAHAQYFPTYSRDIAPIFGRAFWTDELTDFVGFLFPSISVNLWTNAFKTKAGHLRPALWLDQCILPSPIMASKITRLHSSEIAWL